MKDPVTAEWRRLLRRLRSKGASDTTKYISNLLRKGNYPVWYPYRLIEYLMKHAGQVVTRTMLLENVWDYHFDPQTNVIDVHISRLRSKIDKNFGNPLLHTVRGAGYTIRDSAH